MVDQELPRKLAVLLHADVVASTQLVRLNEAVAHHRILDVFNRLSDAIAEYGGTTHEIRGDALIAEFGKASDAVGASLEFQQANKAYNDQLGDEILPVVRIGISIGEVIVADRTVTGEGIVLAQRLEQIAQPGGVCIQGAAYDTLPKRLPFDFEDLGECEIKGFDDRVRTLAVSLRSGAKLEKPVNLVDSSALGKVSFTKPSIAVLPFNNMSDDSEQEYFSDGITEDITTELSRFRHLLVISRNSSFTFKNRSVGVKEIGQELGVSHVVEGSVRKAGNRVRVTAQLVETLSGNHMWAERYDGDLDDIFTVQDEVVASVVSKLGLNLRETTTTFAKGRQTDNSSAYDHLLRGRAAWWRGNWNEGFDHLKWSLDADPSFAAAHAWLALQYAYQNFGSTMGFSDEEIVNKTRQHAESALALDDQDPFVHMAASMAFGFSPRPNKDRGLHHSDISIGMNPHDFDIMFCRAYQLAFFGRHVEALQWLEKARGLNPVNTYMLSECFADIYYMMRNYEQALASFRGQGDVPTQVRLVFAACHAQLGQDKEAFSCRADVEQNCPDGFSLSRFVSAQISACARSEDAEHWREGFRMVGIVS